MPPQKGVPQHNPGYTNGLSLAQIKRNRPLAALAMRLKRLTVLITAKYLIAQASLVGGRVVCRRMMGSLARYVVRRVMRRPCRGVRGMFVVCSWDVRGMFVGCLWRNP